jgi:hypothetical protein
MMRFPSFVVLASATALIGCSSGGKPRVIGDNPTFAPSVEVTATPLVPIGVKLELPEDAHVAMFLVRPGMETSMIYVSDSAQGGRLTRGTHEIATSFGRTPATSDSSRLIRRPPPRTAATQPQGRQPTGTRTAGEELSGFVLVYTSETPLSAENLRQRVVGITVPAFDSDALNTVAKLVRSTAPSGRWAAVAVEYNP